MEPNPYEAPRWSSIVSVSGKDQSRPPTLLTILVSFFCLYLPLMWIPVSPRAEIEMSGYDWPAFVLTLPGEWYAQGCGARMYDYFFFAGVATTFLLLIGVGFGKRSWLNFGIVNTALFISSSLTAYWLWNDLAA